MGDGRGTSEVLAITESWGSLGLHIGTLNFRARQVIAEAKESYTLLTTRVSLQYQTMPTPYERFLRLMLRTPRECLDMEGGATSAAKLAAVTGPLSSFRL